MKNEKAAGIPAAFNMAADESELSLTLGFEALTAVYRPISARLEGNLSFAAAAIAGNGIHLTRSTIAAILGATGSTASRAAAGLVLEAFLCEKFLFAGRENKFGAAVTAGQGLVLVHG